MIVAFMGNDGSGKTTVANETYSFFEKLGFPVIYKHEYEYAILTFLFNMFGKKTIETARKEMIAEKRKTWKYYVWPIMVWFDIFFQWLYFKIFNRGTIVILDRSPYDHFISFEYLGYLTRFTKWLYLHFPKPDIGIVLWVEPAIAFKRKKKTHSYPLEFYEKQTKRYLRLSKDLKFTPICTNMKLIDTLMDTFKVVFSNEILLRLFIKRMKINGLLYETIASKNLHNINSFFESLLICCKKKEKKFVKTLEFIADLQCAKPKARFILIKTFRPFKQVEFNDVDVLVKTIQPEELYEILKLKQGVEAVVFHEENRKADCYVDNLYPVEFQWEIGWSQNVKFVDESGITSFRRRIHDIELNIASPESEVLIIFSHLLFGNATFLTLSEYWYLLHLLKQANAKRIVEHAYKMGWKDECLWMLKMVKKMNNVTFPWFPPFPQILKMFIKHFFLCHRLRSKINFAKTFIVFHILRRFYFQLKLL